MLQYKTKSSPHSTPKNAHPNPPRKKMIIKINKTKSEIYVETNKRKLKSNWKEGRVFYSIK